MIFLSLLINLVIAFSVCFADGSDADSPESNEARQSTFLEAPHIREWLSFPLGSTERQLADSLRLNDLPTALKYIENLLTEGPRDGDLQLKVLILAIDLEKAGYFAETTDLILTLMRLNRNLSMTIVTDILAKNLEDRRRHHFLEIIAAFYVWNDYAGEDFLERHIYYPIQRLDRNWRYEVLKPLIDTIRKEKELGRLFECSRIVELTLYQENRR